MVRSTYFCCSDCSILSSAINGIALLLLPLLVVARDARRKRRRQTARQAGRPAIAYFPRGKMRRGGEDDNSTGSERKETRDKRLKCESVYRSPSFPTLFTFVEYCFSYSFYSKFCFFDTFYVCRILLFLVFYAVSMTITPNNNNNNKNIATLRPRRLLAVKRVTTG